MVLRGLNNAILSRFILNSLSAYPPLLATFSPLLQAVKLRPF
jgi:hypothetical protein